MYLIENYKDNIRFNRQYEEISKFLQIVADNGYNEHFHWGRFDWGMTHSYLDVEMLSRNALFRSGFLQTSWHDKIIGSRHIG